MRPGARPPPPPPPRDAVQSSLCLCLIVFLHCVVEAAVSEGGVYNGECGCFSERWLKLDFYMSHYALHWNVFLFLKWEAHVFVGHA